MSSSSPQKLHLNADSFLWACIEAHQARRLPNGGFNSHTRYEPFLFGTWKEPEQRTFEGLVDELSLIVRHHWSILPQYRRGEVVDLETVSFFSQGAVTVLADIEQVFKAFTGFDLPAIPAERTDTEELPTLTAVVERFESYQKSLTEDSPAFVPWTADGDVEEEKLRYANEVWNLIDAAIEEFLGDYAPVVQIFSRWKYAPKVVAEAIDWRIRPPVGEEFIKWLKSKDPDYFRRQREERRGGRGRDGESRGPRGRDGEGRGDRPPREDRAERPHREDRADRPPREDRAERPHREDRAERPHRERPAEGEEPRGRFTRTGEARPERPHRDGSSEERPTPRRDSFRSDSDERPRRRHDERSRDRDFRPSDRPRRPRSEDSHPPHSSEEELEAVRAEAMQAVETLRNRPDLAEIPLSPVNSFLRRQQHSVVVEAGFETESRGEGRDRCVFVKQKS